VEKDEAGCVELQRFLAADVDPVQRWGCGGLWRMQPHASVHSPNPIRLEGAYSSLQSTTQHKASSTVRKGREHEPVLREY